MVTKRQLGLVIVAASVLMMVGALAADVVDAGQWNRFGPFQRLIVALAGLNLLVGLILVRLGNRPA